MALLKKTLVASTLVETIVASVLFLAIFFVCVDTLTRLGAVRGDEALPAVEADLTACLHRLVTSAPEVGEYRHDYDWGAIDVVVRPYGELDGVRELALTARATGRRTIVLRRLIAVGE